MCVKKIFCAGVGFNFNFKIFRKFIQRNFLIKYIESVGLAFLVVLFLYSIWSSESPLGRGNWALSRCIALHITPVMSSEGAKALSDSARRPGGPAHALQRFHDQVIIGASLRVPGVSTRLAFMLPDLCCVPETGSPSTASLR